jgi:hypothetical protein
MGLSNIKDELFENITEADKQFKNPILNKSIKYKNTKGEDAEGIVGNLLRLPKDHPGRIAAEKLLPADAAEKDAAMQDLGSEKDGKSGELAGQKPSGKEDEAPQAGGEEDKMKQAAAMFDPEVDPAMAARLDREKAASAKLAKTDKEDAAADKKAEDEIKTEELGLDKIYSTKVKEGIKWIYESRWVTLDNKEYLLKTFHNKETKETITTLNDDLLIDHETSTGAEKFINKEHFKALDNLKKELKSKHAI